MVRKGMGKGTGKGYKNLMGSDKKIHSQSAKGIKQPQRVKNIISPQQQSTLIFKKKYFDKFKKLLNPKLPQFIENKVLSEKEINLLKRRLNNKEITRAEVFFLQDEGFRLTLEQEEKGKAWLINLWKTPTGVERKNNPFGYREEEVLKNVDYMELVEFYDNVNYTQAQMGIKNYQPYYRVVSKPDKDGHRDTFEYYAGYSRDNPKNPIQILG